MHPDLLQLQKYGFEIAPDKGMQIALSADHGGMQRVEIVKSPYHVPNHRIHAIWNGDRVKIHFDRSKDSKTHTSSSAHSQAERIRHFMRYVNGELPYRGSFKKFLVNLPTTTEVVPYLETTDGKLSTKKVRTKTNGGIHLLHTLIKFLWKQTA